MAQGVLAGQAQAAVEPPCLLPCSPGYLWSPEPLTSTWVRLPLATSQTLSLPSLSNGTSFPLRIKNATSGSSGTYKCMLRGQNGEHNLSSTVTLKVTGCPGIEEDKVKKYRSELLMLTFLGIFYLLLIFFTCVSNSLSHKQSNNTNQNTPTHFLC
uniref:CD83 molecule n=1 Tax=Cyanoderma ruficeps TaxID=181631 RepID=A0A8C3QKX4_9PASS